MKLRNNDKLASYYLKAESLKDRIENYLNDKNIFDNLLEINIEKENMSIYGLFSNSKISQSMRKNNFIFLNNRPIENRVISFAIKNAYSNAIPKERYPFFFLYINIDCDKVDVNVHPSKKEVRIKNEREISGIIYNSIFDKINEGNSFDSVNIENDINYTPTFKVRNNENSESYENINSYKYNETISNENYNNSYEVKEFQQEREFGEYVKAVGQVFSSFIVAERGSEMYIIDQHAAYERLNYERIYKTLSKGKLEYEKLLVPCEIEYRDYEIDILNNYKEIIESIGIKFEANSKNSIIIEDIPIYMPKNQKIEKIIKDILDIYISKGDNDTLEKLIKHTCSTISCKYSPKAGDKLSNGDMQTLLDLLEKENILTNCPHGRPFVLRLSKDYLDKKFFR